MEKEHFSRFMKSLVEQDPQTMVAFLLQDATYEGNLDRELALQTYDGQQCLSNLNSSGCSHYYR